MEEGSEAQFDTTQKTQEHPKDTLVKKWAEWLLAEEKRPEQVVGEFIAGGATVINYMAAEGAGWEPTVREGARKMISLANNINSPIWGAEALKAGLSFLTRTDRSGLFKTGSLCLVPYPRFTQKGELDTNHSHVFLFNEKQVQDLHKLIR